MPMPPTTQVLLVGNGKPEPWWPITVRNAGRVGSKPCVILYEPEGDFPMSLGSARTRRTHFQQHIGRSSAKWPPAISYPTLGWTKETWEQFWEDRPVQRPTPFPVGYEVVGTETGRVQVFHHPVQVQQIPRPPASGDYPAPPVRRRRITRGAIFQRYRGII